MIAGGCARGKKYAGTFDVKFGFLYMGEFAVWSRYNHLSHVATKLSDVVRPSFGASLKSRGVRAAYCLTLSDPNSDPLV